MNLKPTTKTLYFVLGAGIFISVVRLFTGTGGSGLGNFIDSIVWTSIVLFLSCLIVLFSDLKKYKHSWQIWLLLLISLPISVKFAHHAYLYSIVKLKATTTPDEFLITQSVSKNKYDKDAISLANHVDSLLDVKVVYRPAEKALRYFDGKHYNDTIERNWAIDLPMKLLYEKTIIDTIIYAPFDSSYFTGLLINKVRNKYAKTTENPKGIEYFGSSFIGKKDIGYKISVLGPHTTGSTTLESSSEHLREIYLKRNGLRNGTYNINDVRFWDNINLEKLRKEKRQQITTE